MGMSGSDVLTDIMQPHPDTLIECLPGCADEQHPTLLTPTTRAEFPLSRFARAYVYRRAPQVEV